MKHIAYIEVKPEEAPRTIEDVLILLLRNSVYVFDPRPKIMKYESVCKRIGDDGCEETLHTLTYVNLGDVVIEIEPRYTLDTETGSQVIEKFVMDVYDNTVTVTECNCDCYCEEG